MAFGRIIAIYDSNFSICFCVAANINDRSLLGMRDSEIAAIIRDTETVSGRLRVVVFFFYHHFP